MSEHKHGHAAVAAPEVEDFDVDVDTDLEEVEDVAGLEEDAPKAKAEKAPAAPKRGDLADGWVTPVAFAKYMTENQLHHDKDGNVAELKPQVVYSYIKNAPKDNPFPNSDGQGGLKKVKDSNDVERGAFLLSEGLEWWENRKKKAAERKAAAAEKAAKKTAKAANKPVAGPPGEDQELEEAVEAE